MASIRVNVYDLTSMNKLLRPSKVGVYHTSVVVDDCFEIYYGFYKSGASGVDYSNKIDSLPPSMSGKLYSTYKLGKSYKTVDEIRKIARQMALRDEWLSNRYNCLSHNCHSFSLAFCQEILPPHLLRNFPGFVFKGEKIGSALYENFLSIFIDENNPPFFLNKQPFSKKELRSPKQSRSGPKLVVL